MWRKFASTPRAASAKREILLTHVLLIDDDPRLCELLAEYLSQNGIVVAHASDGPGGLSVLRKAPFDAVIVDIMLPGMDGLEVLRRIRKESQVPVLMLTAKGDETDRVVGLEIGADDYVTKPFGPRELLARLRAILRRTKAGEIQEGIALGELTISLVSREVKRGDTLVELTALEFDILVVLARRAGRVVTREQLLEATGRGRVSDRAVDVHVSHLRAKLGDDPPRRIKTIRGVGYTFVKEPT